MRNNVGVLIYLILGFIRRFIRGDVHPHYQDLLD